MTTGNFRAKLRLPKLSGSRRKRGDTAEDFANQIISAAGYEVIARNWLCRQGELDLVALHHNLETESEFPSTLVVIEVRARAGTKISSAAETVDWKKQQKLLFATGQFLAQHCELAELPLRFDVFSVNTESGEYDWLIDAFQCD